MLSVIALVFATFAATNLDNLLLLIGFQVGGAPQKTLFAGFMAGMLLILMVSAAIGLVSLILPIQYIGFLGVIPLCVGIHMLIEIIRPENPEAPAISNVSLLSVVALQLSNGVDTILVFAPLFADSMVHIDFSIAIAFTLSAFMWFVLATLIGRHALRVEAFTKHGRWIAPMVMIILGLYILDNTVTDLVAGA